MAMLVLLLGVNLPSAHGEHRRWQATESGNELYEQCAQRSGRDEKLVAETFCLGYVVGVADSDAHRACLTAGLEPSDIMYSVVAWLRDHPTLRHQPAAHLMAKALEEIYPCR